LQKFNAFVIDNYQSKLLSEGLKNSSVNREIAVLKHIFSKAHDWEIISDYTYQQIKKVKQLPVDNSKFRWLTVEEWNKLVDTCEYHLRPLIITALNTVMRKTEILELKWQNVNIIDGFIQVVNSKNNESRQIKMNDDIKRLFSKLPRRLDIDYVFFNKYTGKAYTDVKRSFASACKRAKINNFRFHDLRHKFASHMVMRGVRLEVLQKILGHKNFRMTLRYAHLAPDYVSDSVSKLNGISGTWQKLGKKEGTKDNDVL